MSKNTKKFFKLLGLYILNFLAMVFGDKKNQDFIYEAYEQIAVAA